MQNRTKCRKMVIFPGLKQGIFQVVTDTSGHYFSPFLTKFTSLKSRQAPITLKKNILGQRTCQANQAGENSSFIYIVCVKSVPRYHFKLAYVILQMAVKEFFETYF